jgi:Carboxypeptidase regulatory-like domain
VGSRGMKFILWTLVVGLCLGMTALPVRAQVSGATLSGTITDAQGGAVPNAKVSALNAGTSVSSDTTTNSAGTYSIVNLNPGDYTVSVTAQGFSTTTSKVTLTVGAKQEMNLALTVGQVSQTVEVTGAAPQVELESSTVSGNVQSTEIRELPLNGRDWASLATLEPGVASVRTHLDFTHVGAGGRGLGMQLTISGNRPTMNSYRLDGAIVNDYSNAGPGSVLGQNLGVDAIQEFSVLTSNYSAEYGFTSGGVINAVTKSGTNSFHGSAFDFVRNSAFDARNFFTMVPTLLPKNNLTQNQFGASGGWRVLKDKLFLFGAYEGVRKSAGTPLTNEVTISNAVRTGTVVNDQTGAVLTVPVDPNIQKFLPLFPSPTAGAAGCIPLSKGTFNPGGCDPNTGFYSFLGAQKATENFITGRGDYRVSSKDSISGTYLRDNSGITTPQPFNLDQQLITSYRQAIVAEETHIFNAAWVNSFRVAEDRTVNFAGGTTNVALNPAAGDISLGMNTPGITSGFYAPGITITGNDTGTGITPMPGGLGAGPSIQDFWGQIFQVYDDAFATHGNHSIKFGFDFMAYQVNGYTPLATFNGLGTFNSVGTLPAITNPAGNGRTPTAAEAPCLLITVPASNPTNGNSYSPSCGALINFLTDQPQTSTRPFDPSISKQYLRNKIFGGYFQDDWHILPSLTLNLGLRYEMATNTTEVNGRILTMPTMTTALPCVPIPSCGTTSPNSVLAKGFFASNPTLRNFEPRIGFAWDPFHNGKTAVRGGFGVFDALPLAYIMSLNNTQAAPWRSTLATAGNPTQNVVPSPPQGTWPYGVPAQVGATQVNNPTSRGFYYTDYSSVKRNYVYQYNLNIQRQITPTMTLMVGYSGSRGLHNPFSSSFNLVLPVDLANPVPGVGLYWPTTWTGGISTSALQQQLFNPTMGAAGSSTLWQSNSWYNALQVKLDRKMSHGFQVQGAFTWSKSMDNTSGSIKGDVFGLGTSGGVAWYDINQLDRGLSEFNIGKNLVVNALWNVPSTKMLGAFGDRVLGGWQLGTIVSLSDGVPVSPGIGTDILGQATTGGLEPPNVVAGCSPQNLVNPNYRTSLLYVNTACLSLVPQTAANLPYCAMTGNPTVPLAAPPPGAGFVGFCPNIRGDLGRNTVIGPGFANVDFSVFKNNYVPKISETFNVQFRAEFFNLFNRTNFSPAGGPPLSDSVITSTGAINPNYSRLTATQGANRQIQLALKLVW